MKQLIKITDPVTLEVTEFEMDVRPGDKILSNDLNSIRYYEDYNGRRASDSLDRMRDLNNRIAVSYNNDDIDVIGRSRVATVGKYSVVLDDKDATTGLLNLTKDMKTNTYSSTSKASNDIRYRLLDSHVGQNIRVDIKSFHYDEEGYIESMDVVSSGSNAYILDKMNVSKCVYDYLTQEEAMERYERNAMSTVVKIVKDENGCIYLDERSAYNESARAVIDELKLASGMVNATVKKVLKRGYILEINDMLRCYLSEQFVNVSLLREKAEPGDVLKVFIDDYVNDGDIIAYQVSVDDEWNKLGRAVANGKTARTVEVYEIVNSGMKVIDENCTYFIPNKVFRTNYPDQQPVIGQKYSFTIDTVYVKTKSVRFVMNEKNN